MEGQTLQLVQMRKLPPIHRPETMLIFLSASGAKAKICVNVSVCVDISCEERGASMKDERDFRHLVRGGARMKDERDLKVLADVRGSLQVQSAE